MPILLKLFPLMKRSGTQSLVPVFQIGSKIRYRYFSTGREESHLTKTQEKSDISTDVRPIGEKIKEGTKTVSYTGVILLGVGVTGIIFYYVFRELFSSNSANSIYSKALEKCKNVSK